MKRFPTPILPVLLALLMTVCLTVGACGTSSIGGSPSVNSNSSATATPAKSHPTSVPVASMAECSKLLSISEANQATNPVSPASLIFPLEVSGSALCYYENGQHQTTVFMIFKPYSGGDLTTNVQKAASSSLSHVTITNSQSVSEVGDQALYVTITGTSTVNGVAIPVKENILFVVAGAVSFGIINIIYNDVDPLGSASAAMVLSDFEQIARLVMSRL